MQLIKPIKDFLPDHYSDNWHTVMFFYVIEEVLLQFVLQ